MSRLDEIDKIIKERGYSVADDWYEILILEYGAPQPGIRPDGAYANSWRGRVPDILIRMWLEHGFGSWQRGKFWLCDPAVLQPVLDNVLAGDPDYDPKAMVPFGYSAFGDMYMWLSNYSIMRIKWLYNSATISTRPKWNKYASRFESEDDAIIKELNGLAAPTSDNQIDGAAWLDDEGLDMLPDAIGQHGELQMGEIYGFFPTLSLGGANNAKNLQRVPVTEHLLLLAELQRPILKKYIEPKEGAGGFGTIKPIRPLGAQQEQ